MCACVYILHVESTNHHAPPPPLPPHCSTFLDPDTRHLMGEQAVALAQAVSYSSAGEPCCIQPAYIYMYMYMYMGMFVCVYGQRHTVVCVGGGSLTAS